MKIPSAALIAALLLAGCTAQPASNTPPATDDSTAPSALPSPPELPALEDVEPGTSLAPGTYVLHYGSIGGGDRFPTLAVTFAVPDGWERVRVDGLLWNDAGVRLLFAVVDNLYVDPCEPGRGVWAPPVGPSVSDLTTALMTLPGFEEASVAEAAFYGFGGQQLRVTAAASCSGEDARLFHQLGSPGYSLPPDEGDELELRILNVGGTRFMVAAIRTADATAAARSDLQAVLDSIQIQP